MENNVKTHKFFERHLKNDLNALDNYLHGIYHTMRDQWWFGDPEHQDNGMTADVTKRYNLFRFDNQELKALKDAVKDMTKEACQYYGLDYGVQNYQVVAWFNLWKNHGKTSIEEKPWHFHDKVGAPHFHGYYCVNAEPSLTHYKIFDKEFDNVNQNNRAILSETGHAHTPGDWLESFDRITIAFDVLPFNKIGVSDLGRWLPLE